MFLRTGPIGSCTLWAIRREFCSHYFACMTFPTMQSHPSKGNIATMRVVHEASLHWAILGLRYDDYRPLT